MYLGGAECYVPLAVLQQYGNELSLLKELADELVELKDGAGEGKGAGETKDLKPMKEFGLRECDSIRSLESSSCPARVAFSLTTDPLPISHDRDGTFRVPGPSRVRGEIPGIPCCLNVQQMRAHQSNDQL